MKKKPLRIIMIGIVVVLFLGLIAFLLNKNGLGTADYTVHYHSDFYTYVYDIEVKGDTLYVEKKEVVMCFRAPCNPITVDSFKVKYSEEYQELMENLFKDKDTKEITITKSDLSDKEKEIMASIVGRKVEEENAIAYKIVDTSRDNRNYPKRGYYVENSNGKVIVTVAMGERGTGGYGISVAKVSIIDGGAQIYVEETSPSKGAIVTQAFTYPIVQVEFSQMPEYILVQSLDTFQNFEQVDTKE